MTIEGVGPGPLVGLRILDISTTPSGSQAAQLFADFGAEVVLVEPPGGSPMRAAATFAFLARGKKSVELDLKSPDDHAIAKSMALGADVLIETFRPGVMERLGLGYDELSAQNPGLVYVSITGFGRTGPYAGVKGYEALVMARIGGLSVVANMVARKGPAFISVQFGAYAAAQTALSATLAALHEREHSGLGQRVDTSLVQGIASLATWNWFLRVITDKYPGAFTPQAPFTEQNVPTSPLFFMLLICLTSDGHWLQFSQVQPRLFLALMKALGLEWMYSDPKWKTAPVFDDDDKRVEFWEKMLTAARQKSLVEWQELMDNDHDVWAETMRRGSELLDHPQMTHLGAVVEIEDPARGTVRMPGPLVMMSATPATIRAAPGRNEHGAEIRRAVWSPRTTVDHPVSSNATPFEGVTILELGTFFAAPFGATVLAELGARVIKVEPLEGEPMRTILPFPEVGGAKVLQGKESIAVDLGTDEGRAIVHQLARRSDIVLQSFRAGVAARQGVDEATLRALNPSLIYLSAPGYGVDGPCGDRPAYAPTIGAGSGITMRNLGTSVPARPDLTIAQIRESSVRLSVGGTSEFAQADGLAAVSCATAMALGLLIRDRTGTAQAMLTTMLTSAAHALCDDMVTYAGRPDTPTADSELFGYGARYRLYECRIGWIFLAAPATQEWNDLCTALVDDFDLGADARFADEAFRQSNDARLAEALSKVFLTRDANEWERRLLAFDVGAVVVDDGPPEKVLQSTEFGRASGLVTDVEHPTFGDHPRLTPYSSLSRTPGITEPACLLGEHTDRLLEEFGFSRAAIDGLRERGVVG